MTNQDQSPNDKRKYNLEEKTAIFGESVIDFARTLPRDVVVLPLISQVVRSSTSVAQIIWKQIAPNRKRIFGIKLEFARRKQKKQPIGYG